jgi:hypothetical protein
MLPYGPVNYNVVPDQQTANLLNLVNTISSYTGDPNNANQNLVNPAISAYNPATGGGGTTGGSTTGGTTGLTGSGSGINPALNQQYLDTQHSILNTQLSGLGPQRQSAEASVLNQYQTGMNNLDVQNAQGQRNLDLSTKQVNTSKAQSLQQLKDQVASMYEGYLRTPGVSDSSAGGMIGNALGRSASKNRFGVLQNSSNQLNQIGNQQQDMQVQYDQSRTQLDSWKQQTLNQIQQDFAAKQADIQQKLASADATQAQALAQQNAAYTQQAISALQNLQSVYSQTQQQINQSYLGNAPTNPDLGQLGQYAVKPIDAGKLQGFRQGTNINQGQTPDLVAPIFKKPNDQFSFA